MKILFLANRIPYPPYRGDKLKIYNLAKRLSKHHELHLLTFVQDRDDLQYEPQLRELFTKVKLIYLPSWLSAIKCLAGLWSSKPFQVLYFQSGRMSRAVKEFLREDHYDAVHVQHLRMSPYLSRCRDIARILDLPDAFSLYWKRRKALPANWLVRMFNHREHQRVLRYERVLQLYNRALVCSAEDLEYLKHEHHLSNLRLLPNGVDTEQFTPARKDYKHAGTLLFTGNMDYAPNVDAVTFFAESVFPLILEQFPQTKLIIAGQRPVAQVQELASDRIEVTGFVENLATMYDRASVVVAPLRFGAGTQNKVLEAMSMGVPVVCTQIGFSGLGIESGEGVFMELHPKEFAARVCQLLGSEMLRMETGVKGMNVIQQKFSWDIIAKTLEGYCEEVAEMMRAKGK